MTPSTHPSAIAAAVIQATLLDPEWFAVASRPPEPAPVPQPVARGPLGVTAAPCSTRQQRLDGGEDCRYRGPSASPEEVDALHALLVVITRGEPTELELLHVVFPRLTRARVRRRVAPGWGG